MLAVPLIVHHKKDKRLRAGIVVDQQIVMQPSPLNPAQGMPVVLCSVVWDESVIAEDGEIQVPADDARMDAICLHPAGDLVFDGPYNQVENDFDEDEDEDEDDNEEIATVQAEEDQPTV